MNALQTQPSTDAPHTLLPGEIALLDRLIEREIERMTRTTDGTGDTERPVDPIDVAAALTLRETETAIQDRFASGIIDWMDARRRLRESPATFGTCACCGGRIPFERLEILPATRNCRACG